MVAKNASASAPVAGGSAGTRQKNGQSQPIESPPPAFPNKLVTEAVEKIRTDWCADFFKGRKLDSKRVFANYQDKQAENVMSSYGLASTKSDGPYYQEVDGIPITAIRGDESLQSQDRRDLDVAMVCPSTMRSFQKNVDIDVRRLVLRYMADGSYLVGDGRHRYVWSLAIGCSHVNAYVVYNCTDDQWNDLRVQFNDTNGLQRTEEERLLVVYKKVLLGGYGAAEALCQEHGVSFQKYQIFKKGEEVKREVEKAGLKVTNGTPVALLEEVVKLHKKDKKLDPAMLQTIVDAGASNASVVGPTKPVPSKAFYAETLKPLLSGAPTEEKMQKVLSDMKVKTKRAAAGGGRGLGRDNATKLRERLEMVHKITKKTTPDCVGIPARELLNMRKIVQEILDWFDGK